MSTQKTRIGSTEEAPAGVSAPPTEEASMPPSVDEFLPSSKAEEVIMGHKVHKVSGQELLQQHLNEAGDVPIVADMSDPAIKAKMAAQKTYNEQQARQQADDLMAGWVQDATPQAPPQAAPASAPEPSVAPPRVNAIPMNEETASVIKTLTDRISRAQREGDLMTARELQGVLANITEAVDTKRVHEPKGRHPVMAKLAQSLGLEKIKPAEVEWAGAKWHFRPANSLLDVWLRENLWSNKENLPFLRIASNLVGIDDTPLYEVFSLDLKHTYAYDAADGPQTVDVNPYQKFCETCFAEVALASDKCTSCGASQSPFNMPLALRLLCAERFYRYVQEEFGPVEHLVQLMVLMREAMPDRLVDGESLYPLAVLSPDQKKTDS